MAPRAGTLITGEGRVGPAQHRLPLRFRAKFPRSRQDRHFDGVQKWSVASVPRRAGAQFESGLASCSRNGRPVIQQRERSYATRRDATTKSLFEHVDIVDN